MKMFSSLLFAGALLTSALAAPQGPNTLAQYNPTLRTLATNASTLLY